MVLEAMDKNGKDREQRQTKQPEARKTEKRASVGRDTIHRTEAEGLHRAFNQ